MSMDWDNEKSIQLIQLYESRRELWDSEHKYYHNKNKKHDAWLDISSRMDCAPDLAKGKISSLLSSFRREKNKEANSTGTGKGRDEVYNSKWFGYEAFQFLMDKNKCHKTLNTERETEYQHAENDWDPEDPSGTETIPINKTNVDEPEGRNDSQETAEVDTSLPPSREVPTRNFPGPTPKKKPKTSATSDPRLHEAFQLLQRTAQRDECEIYGEHVAAKLRNYTKRTQSFVQHLIGDILFKADMGVYDGNTDPPQRALSTNSGGWYGAKNRGLPTSTPQRSPHDLQTGSQQVRYSTVASEAEGVHVHRDEAPNMANTPQGTEPDISIPSASNYLSHFNPHDYSGY